MGGKCLWTALFTPGALPAYPPRMASGAVGFPSAGASLSLPITSSPLTNVRARSLSPLPFPSSLPLSLPPFPSPPSTTLLSGTQEKPPDEVFVFLCHPVTCDCSLLLGNLPNAFCVPSGLWLKLDLPAVFGFRTYAWKLPFPLLASLRAAAM